MIEIIPSIISNSFAEFEEKVGMVDKYVDKVQLDIMDGVFVDGKTFDGINESKKINTDCKIDVHLMIAKPENHIIQWLSTPVDTIYIHWESTNKIQQIINTIRDESDKSIGLVFNPETDYSDFSQFDDQIDFVQFMTVHPGKYGAKFIPEVLNKIADFHFSFPEIAIAVDGGVDNLTAPQIIKAGASLLVSGSYIFNNPDLSIEESIENLELISK